MRGAAVRRGGGDLLCERRCLWVRPRMFGRALCAARGVRGGRAALLRRDSLQRGHRLFERALRDLRRRRSSVLRRRMRRRVAVHERAVPVPPRLHGALRRRLQRVRRGLLLLRRRGSVRRADLRPLRRLRAGLLPRQHLLRRELLRGPLRPLRPRGEPLRRGRPIHLRRRGRWRDEPPLPGRALRVRDHLRELRDSLHAGLRVTLTLCGWPPGRADLQRRDGVHRLRWRERAALRERSFGFGARAVSWRQLRPAEHSTRARLDGAGGRAPSRLVLGVQPLRFVGGAVHPTRRRECHLARRLRRLVDASDGGDHVRTLHWTCSGAARVAPS